MTGKVEQGKEERKRREFPHVFVILLSIMICFEIFNLTMLLFNNCSKIIALYLILNYNMLINLVVKKSIEFLDLYHNIFLWII